LQHRLEHKGIVALATAETDPDNAVAAWLSGSLIEQPPMRMMGMNMARAMVRETAMGTGTANLPKSSRWWI
jgi:hypothetical protein